MDLVLGIDDAGRGPVIGSMFLAGALMTKEQEKLLKKENVTDSKLLYHNQRVRMSKLIKKNSISHKIVKTSALEIDKTLKSPETNLNKLEAQEAARIINSLNISKSRISVIIDCPSVNINAWKKTLMQFITTKTNLTIKCEHKADLRHTSVSAASILAKVAREEEMAKLKSDFKKYGDIGSGYPSDPKTIKFLKNHGKELENSGLFRKTWSTWKRMFPDKEQSSLADF